MPGAVRFFVHASTGDARGPGSATRKAVEALGLGGGSRLTGVLVLGRAEIRDLPSTAKYDSILKSVAQSG